jgi:hypothetical protein
MKVTILRENEIRECVGMNQEAVDAVASPRVALRERDDGADERQDRLPRSGIAR